MGEINRILGDAGAGIQFEAAGRRWTLSALTKGRQGEFEAYLEALAYAKAERTGNAAFVSRVEDKIAGGHYGFGGKVCQAALATPDGAVEMLRILLRPAHPETTTESVLALLEADGEAVNAALRRLIESTSRKGAGPNPPTAPAVA